MKKFKVTIKWTDGTSMSCDYEVNNKLEAYEKGIELAKLNNASNITLTVREVK